MMLSRSSTSASVSVVFARPSPEADCRADEPTPSRSSRTGGGRSCGRIVTNPPSPTVASSVAASSARRSSRTFSGQE